MKVCDLDAYPLNLPPEYPTGTAPESVAAEQVRSTSGLAEKKQCMEPGGRQEAAS